MIRSPSVLASAFLAFGILGVSARADLALTVQEDSGPAQSWVIAGSPIFGLAGFVPSVITPDYQITDLSVSAIQSGILNPVQSSLTLSVTSITNTTGIAGQVLRISVVGSGYTAPVAPPSLSMVSSISGTIYLSSAGDSLSYQAAVPTATFVGPPPGLQTPDITPPNVSYLSNTPAASISLLAAPFSITESIAVVLNGKNDSISLPASVSLTTVPEPSTMVIAGFGGLGLIGYGIRRRRASGA